MLVADSGQYWRIAENTGGWREILADGEGILADGEKYWRMARFSCG